MQAGANRELVERFYRKVINERNLDVIGELISDDFVHRRWTGTRPGTFQRIDPTGHKVEFQSTAKIIEHRAPKARRIPSRWLRELSLLDHA